MNWPRLSETLTEASDRYTCQACGTRTDLPQLWQEHDEQDQPQPIAITLCKVCSDRIIESHPRLYAQIDAGQPFPGAMPVCDDCAYRARLRCTHPDLKANGGSGLSLSLPRPTTGIACTRGKGCRHVTIWRGPVECKGKCVIDGDGKCSACGALPHPGEPHPEDER